MAGERTVKISILGQSKGAQDAFNSAEKSAGGFEKKIGGIAKGAALGFAATGAGIAVGLGAITGSAISALVEIEKLNAQTDTVLKSTGGAANVTAEDIGKMAESIENLSGLEAEAVQSGQNMLLTFTGIKNEVGDGNDIFDQTTKTMADMSVAMGTDMKSTALQLGKALNDPIKGMASLQRVGVSFTDSQRDQITALQESGDTMGAQKIILAELDKQFGGSAEALGDTFGGQVNKVKNLWGTLTESMAAPIFAALMPQVEKLTAALQSPAFAAFAETMGRVLVDGFSFVVDAAGKLYSFFQSNLLPIFMLAWDAIRNVSDAFGEGGLGGAFAAIPGAFEPVFAALQGLGQKLIDWITPMIPPLLVKLGEFAASIFVFMQTVVLPRLIEEAAKLAGALLDWIGPMIPPLLQKLGEFVNAAGAWLGETGLPMLAGKLEEWGQALIAWIGPRIPPVLEELGKLLEQVGSWLIDTALPGIAGKLEEWGGAFVAWVQPQIMPLLEQLGGLLSDVGSWLIDTGLPAVAAKLEEWGAAFVAWVGPQIMPLLSELGRLLADVGTWLVSTALPEIIGKLSQWAQEFVAWVGPQIGPLLSELGRLLADVGTWMVTVALPEILSKLGQWASEFVAWVGPQIPPLLQELGKLIVEVSVWITTVALPMIIRKLVDWGGAFLGFIAKDVLPFLGEKLLAIATFIGQWVIDNAPTFAGKVAGIGASIVDGIWQGISDSTQWLVDKLTQWVEDSIPGPIRKALELFSPSRVGRRIGANFGGSIGMGIDDMGPMVARKASRIGDIVAENAQIRPFALPGVSGNMPLRGTSSMNQMPDSQSARSPAPVHVHLEIGGKEVQQLIVDAVNGHARRSY